MRQAVRKLEAAFLPRLGFGTCSPWPEIWGVGLALEEFVVVKRKTEE